MLIPSQGIEGYKKYAAKKKRLLWEINRLGLEPAEMLDFWGTLKRLENA